MRRHITGRRNTLWPRPHRLAARARGIQWYDWIYACGSVAEISLTGPIACGGWSAGKQSSLAVDRSISSRNNAQAYYRASKHPLAPAASSSSTRARYPVVRLDICVGSAAEISLADPVTCLDWSAGRDRARRSTSPYPRATSRRHIVGRPMQPLALPASPCSTRARYAVVRPIYARGPPSEISLADNVMFTEVLGWLEDVDYLEGLAFAQRAIDSEHNIDKMKKFYGAMKSTGLDTIRPAALLHCGDRFHLTKEDDLENLVDRLTSAGKKAIHQHIQSGEPEELQQTIESNPCLKIVSQAFWDTAPVIWWGSSWDNQKRKRQLITAGCVIAWGLLEDAYEEQVVKPVLLHRRAYILADLAEATCHAEGIEPWWGSRFSLKSLRRFRRGVLKATRDDVPSDDDGASVSEADAETGLSRVIPVTGTWSLNKFVTKPKSAFDGPSESRTTGDVQDTPSTALHEPPIPSTSAETMNVPARPAKSVASTARAVHTAASKSHQPSQLATSPDAAASLQAAGTDTSGEPAIRIAHAGPITATSTKATTPTVRAAHSKTNQDTTAKTSTHITPASAQEAITSAGGSAHNTTSPHAAPELPANSKGLTISPPRALTAHHSPSLSPAPSLEPADPSPPRSPAIYTPQMPAKPIIPPGAPKPNRQRAQTSAAQREKSGTIQPVRATPSRAAAAESSSTISRPVVDNRADDTILSHMPSEVKVNKRPAKTDGDVPRHPVVLVPATQEDEPDSHMNLADLFGTDEPVPPEDIEMHPLDRDDDTGDQALNNDPPHQSPTSEPAPPDATCHRTQNEIRQRLYIAGCIINGFLSNKVLPGYDGQVIAFEDVSTNEFLDIDLDNVVRTTQSALDVAFRFRKQLRQDMVNSLLGIFRSSNPPFQLFDNFAPQLYNLHVSHIKSLANSLSKIGISIHDAHAEAALMAVDDGLFAHEPFTWHESGNIELDFSGTFPARNPEVKLIVGYVDRDEIGEVELLSPLAITTIGQGPSQRIALAASVSAADVLAYQSYAAGHNHFIVYSTIPTQPEIDPEELQTGQGHLFRQLGFNLDQKKEKFKLANSLTLGLVPNEETIATTQSTQSFLSRGPFCRDIITSTVKPVNRAISEAVKDRILSEADQLEAYRKKHEEEDLAHWHKVERLLVEASHTLRWESYTRSRAPLFEVLSQVEGQLVNTAYNKFPEDLESPKDEDVPKDSSPHTVPESSPMPVTMAWSISDVTQVAATQGRDSSPPDAIEDENEAGPSTTHSHKRKRKQDSDGQIDTRRIRGDEA
ncbi:hypothetical protein CTheo_8288 [Ceratobasidium theobromae]|uniref:Uncharacterized protein n=1 Tax=Ceratobasidium theobromae TaxID=1582974 RepID=A0A5N5QA47_9AGAM|nr:hypothetical protein CTheo_8288 [Ceratobasidium theobromae]